MLTKKVLPHILAVAAFLVLSSVYFIPQLEGKVLLQKRGTTNEAVSHALNEYHEDTGDWPKWADAMFSGMPAYMIYKGNRSNVLRFAEAFSRMFIGGPIGYFFGGMVALYILFMVMRVEILAAFAGAAGFVLSTGSLVMVEEGQITLLRSLFTMAPAIAGLLLIWRKQYLTGSVVLAATLGINYWMANYKFSALFTFFLLVYVLIELVQAARRSDWSHFLKGTGATAGAILLAFATVAGMALPRMEFISESTGGTPILENNTSQYTDIGKVEGLPWEEVTRWSNNGLDLLAVMIPRAAGGSASEALGEDSRLWQDFRSRGVRIGNDFKVPLYFGGLPATNGPLYMGAALLLLCLLGAVVVKGTFKWWALGSMLIAAMLSMGHNLDFFGKIFYSIFPYYDIITHPSDLLSVAILMGAILGTLGLSAVIKGKVASKQLWTAIAVSGGLLAVIAVIVLIGGSQLSDFSGVSDTTYAAMGYTLDALKDDRLAGMQNDAIRTLLLVLLGVVILGLYAWRKINATVMAGLYVVLILVDVAGVNMRYITGDDFISKSDYRDIFKLNNIDREIAGDNVKHFRVHDVTTDAWASAQGAYRYKMIGGFQDFKLQRYHDLMEYYLYEGDNDILAMLNTRYYIVPDDTGAPFLRRAGRVRGNAWFVEGIKVVKTDDEEIEALRGSDLTAMAIVHEDFREYVDGFDPSRNGSIQLTEYSPDRIVYSSTSQSDQLAVFSEIWYDHGWKAYIDGQPAKLIRANYLLRALNVPEGTHEIEMVFEPVVYATGNAISWVSSIGLFLGLLWVLWTYVRAQMATPKTSKKSVKAKKR